MDCEPHIRADPDMINASPPSPSTWHPFSRDSCAWSQRDIPNKGYDGFWAEYYRRHGPITPPCLSWRAHTLSSSGDAQNHATHSQR